MTTPKVWNLKYVAGNTGRQFSDASNPQRRTEALESARQVAANGWRAWVEHHATGKRIFESDQEREHLDSTGQPPADADANANTAPVDTPKLTGAQKRVMRWLGKGWITEHGAGSGVMVNGKRICNTDTMLALHRSGLVSRDERDCWFATPSGKAVTAQLDL